MSSAHSYRKYVEFVVLCLLASALLWWFGRNLDWAEVSRAVRDSDPLLLIAAVLIISRGLLFPRFSLGRVIKTTDRGAVFGLICRHYDRF